MTGTRVLAGGEEFGGRMREVDEQAMRAAGGAGAVIRVVPTAAAADAGHERAGRVALEWFASLGATDVAVVPVLDRASADDPAVLAPLAGADLVYLPGGSPAYLAQALVGSRCAAVLRERYEAGAVLAGRMSASCHTTTATASAGSHGCARRCPTPSCSASTSGLPRW